MDECRGGLIGVPHEGRRKISPVFAVLLKDVGVGITLFARENIPFFFLGPVPQRKKMSNPSELESCLKKKGGKSLTWQECQRGWA